MSDKPATKSRKGIGGQPKKILDPEQLFELASIHCTMTEIAAVMKCSIDHLYKPEYFDIIQNGREGGRASLRRLQWAAAQKGNTGMLIWLGKQLLGQKDQNQLTVADERAELSKLSDEEIAQRLKNAVKILEGGKEVQAFKKDTIIVTEKVPERVE